MHTFVVGTPLFFEIAIWVAKETMQFRIDKKWLFYLYLGGHIEQFGTNNKCPRRAR